MMAQYASILFSMILVNNYVLVKFLGICPFLGVSKKFDSAVGMGCAVTLVMVLAIAVTWPIQQLLDAWGLGYLQTIAFILVIATVVRLLEMAIKKFVPPLYSHAQFFVTPWTIAHQTSLSMGILQARILEWVAMPSPSGDLPDPGIEPASLMSPALAGGFFTTRVSWETLL